MSLTQRIRGRIIVDAYAHWDVRGKKVLDVGCGNGEVSKVLRQAFDLDLHGTDVFDYCQGAFPFTPMTEADRLPFEDNTFDIVMFNDMLHHTGHIRELIDEGKRVAKEILIFEDKQLFYTAAFDKTVNLFYHTEMNCPMNFKTEAQWRQLFDDLGLICETATIRHPVLYPLRHMAFHLTKDKD